MKIVYSWLKKFVEVHEPPERLAEILTAAGMKVEKIHRVGEGLEGVVVGEVLKIEPHPNADKLIVVTADTGSQQLRIVCGASNFQTGDRVPVAAPGARLPGLGVLEARKFRGVMSEGMLCSAAELGVGTDHTGILVLPEDSKTGVDVREMLGGSDAVLELEITPNRPDAMSLIGIAREVAAFTGGEIKEISSSVAEGSRRAEDLIKVTVQDPKGCPRYLARVIEGVTVGPSPDSVQRLLALAGIRPISNVVDATNYALLITGHPLHAFDLSALEESTIVVRRAVAGEKLITIDGAEISLDTDDVVIADAARPVALAGIMGGRDTEVTESTQTVALESAYFDPPAIFRASQRHQLRTESSARFERGADPNNVDFAADLAASLMLQWAGGQAAAGRVDIYPAPAGPRIVTLRTGRANLLLGTKLEEAEMIKSFERLGLPASAVDGSIAVQVPTRRADLVLEEDLVEEIARVVGYDNIPSTLPGGEDRIGSLPLKERLLRRLKAALATAGLFEARSSILISPSDFEWSSPGAPVQRLANPLSEDESVLRGSLLPGLARSAGRNFARRNTEVRLFEFGNIFGDEEVPRLGIAVGGVTPTQWFGPARPLDFYDLKAAIEVVAATLHIDGFVFKAPAGREPYHGPESAGVSCGETPVGAMGRLGESVASKLDLEYPVYVAELDFQALLDVAGPEAGPRVEAARFPAVFLDLAVSVPEQLSAGDVLGAIREAGGDILEAVRLIDVYQGEQVGAERKSLAFSMVFRSTERTLRDREALKARDAAGALIAERYGGVVRS
ncbi:MAG: phenylalanine--tRNA ligase subunit beta [Actinomycetota bacterium]